MFKKYAEIYGEIWNKSFETSAEILKKSGEIWENVVSNEDFAKHCLATLESVSNATKPAEWLETTLLGRPVQVGQTPYEIVWREGTASLRFYQSSTPKDKKPLFIVYAMVNRPYILDLISDRSVIQKILNSGRDVYLLDWGEPTQNESELPLSYFTHYLINSAVDAVLTRENIDSLPLLGYCQGGTFSLLYALKEEQKISSLTLMATPVDFSKMGLLSLWAKHLDPSIFLNEKGNVDGWRLRMAFENLRPFHLPLRWQGFGKKILEGDIGEVEKEHFAAMEKWINDDRDIPGQAFCEFVERFYKRNELVESLGDLSLPIQILVGSKDHLVPKESTLAIQKLNQKSEFTIREVKVGHIGLSVSQKSHQNLWPQVLEWLE